CKQLCKALEALNRDGPLSDDVVHDARKRLKKARALLRLLREALGSRTYGRENVCLRDAALPLTEVRDAKVLVDTFDKLAQRRDDKSTAQIRQDFVEHQQEVRQRLLEEGDGLTAVKQSLEGARARAKQWRVGRKNWSFLGIGLKKTYRRG